MAESVLLVEDDPDIVRNLEEYLRTEGFEVAAVSGQEEALTLLEERSFDLVLLDITLSSGSGYGICRAVRANYDIPVIFLTALGDEFSVLAGFDMGADDYMVKPADEEELLLRIAALLRRAQAACARRLQVGSTTLFYDDLAVEWDGRRTELPRKEFLLLYKLLSCPDKTFTRRQLMDEVWDMDTDSDEHTVNVHINRLRDKFGENRDFAIVTVRGLGYKAVRL